MRINRIALLGAVFGNLVGCAGFLVYADMAEKEWLAADRLQNVRDEIEQVYRACLDAETGQRGYLLTGRDYYLQPHLSGVLSARDHLSRLQSHSPNRTTELERINREAEDKFEELEQTITMVRNGEKPKAYTVVDSDRGKKSMERIRGALDDLIRKETVDMEAHRAAAKRSAANAVSTALGCMVLSTVLGMFGVLATTAPETERRP